MRTRYPVIIYTILGGAFGAVGALTPGALGRGASDILGVVDFLKIGAAGALFAVPGALLERSARKLLAMTLAGVFTSQVLVLLLIFIARRFTSASAILGAFLVAAGVFPAVLALIDRLSGGDGEEIPYAMLLAAVGGILGLALGWLVVREDVSPALLWGTAYGAGIWTAIGFSKRIPVSEGEPLPRISEESDKKP